MKVFSQCDEVREHIKFCKAKQETIALVPTMGHLHNGHTSLVNLAKSKATHVLVSIFVNPIQFNEINDYERYPRTLESDLEILRTLNVDTVFIPKQNELYPHGTSLAAKIIIPELTDIFEGVYRPGHFDGVCTVVSKLFNIVSPHAAIFGQKDYQQLLVIQRLVEDLNYDIEVLSGDTIRETDGLAMSSRNSYLSASERDQAALIFKMLTNTKDQFSINHIEKLESTATCTLGKHGFEVEYFSIRDALNLQPISQATENIVVLTAAWLGNTRLIDNLLFPMT